MCLGVLIHCVDTGYKSIFALTGERLTRNLRVLTLRQLLQQEVGFFDDEAHSVGALTSFLAEKVPLHLRQTQRAASKGRAPGSSSGARAEAAAGEGSQERVSGRKALQASAQA